MFVSAAAQDSVKEKEKEHNVITAEGDGVRLNVTFSKARYTTKSELIKKYDAGKYDLSQGHTFPQQIRALIPKDTPEFLNDGEDYTTRVMRALFHFKQCALVGPRGTGKSHIARLIAEMNGLPLWEVRCSLESSLQELIGTYSDQKTGSWIDGKIVSWCRHGGILFLDDANLLSSSVAIKLDSALGPDGHIVLSEKDDEVVPRHPACYVILGVNPSSAEFSSRSLGILLKRKVSAWIDFDYLSVGNNVSPHEISYVENKSGVSYHTATGIVRIAAELRKRHKANELPSAPSVRDLVNWATLIGDGVPPIRAAEDTVIALISDSKEVKDQVRGLIRMIFSDTSKVPISRKLLGHPEAEGEVGKGKESASSKS